MTEESLIAQNPRDSIILLREKSLQERKEAKKALALSSHDEILKKYSKQFFQNDAMFDNLDPHQKKELAKFCASYCRRWLASLFLPTGLGLAATLFLGSFFSPGWFLGILLWAFVSLIGIVSVGGIKERLEHVNIEHYWPFLKAHKKINQVEKKTNFQIESGNPKNE